MVAPHAAAGPTDESPKNVVIMGCGRTGAVLASALAEAGHLLRVLDLDAAAFDRLPEGLVQSDRVVPVVGNGTLESDLRKASVQDADVYIAASGRDTVNILSAQLAKHALQVRRVVCRTKDPTKREVFGQLGLLTVSPTMLVTEAVLKATNG